MWFMKTFLFEMSYGMYYKRNISQIPYYRPATLYIQVYISKRIFVLQIFYPDLIDKTKAPEYSVIPIDDDPDFSILKFSAGPPYEVRYIVWLKKWHNF